MLKPSARAVRFREIGRSPTLFESLFAGFLLADGRHLLRAGLTPSLRHLFLHRHLALFFHRHFLGSGFGFGHIFSPISHVPGSS